MPSMPSMIYYRHKMTMPPNGKCVVKVELIKTLKHYAAAARRVF